MGDFVELRQIMIAVLRGWWLLILSALVAGAVGYGISQRQPPVYQATATIMVGQSIQSTDLTKTDIQTSELLAQTYANIARRQPVLQGVIQALDLSDSEQTLKKQVSIKLVAGTQLLELKVEAESREKARLIADELARQLLLQSPSGVQNEAETEKQQLIDQRLDSLRTRIQDGQQRLEMLKKQLTVFIAADELRRELEQEVNALEDQIFDWEDRYVQLLISTENQQSPNQLAIIEPAKVNNTPVSPRPKLYVFLASILGLMLALGLVFVREYLDNTIKSTEALSEQLGIPSLGTANRIKVKTFPDELLASSNFALPWLEPYRMIRTNIQFMSIDDPAKSILVTSTLPGEGKSTTAANLGVVMAQADLRTIIVDADLRRPTQHKIFQTPNIAGLTDYLLATKPDLNDYLKKTPIKNLSVLTSGELPSYPSELLGSQRMAHLITCLREAADMVIVDSPPVAVFTDAAVLSTKMDGVVLAVMTGQTRSNVARQAVLRLQQVGANILGGILNGVTSKNEQHYYHTYRTNGRINSHQQINSLPQDSPPHRWRQRLPFSK